MKNKGFTLVELLAVIVILAIIMIIAIPAVLNTMQNASRNTFETYARRIANETEKKFTEDSLNNTNNAGLIYDITKDLGLSNTGDFKGYSILSKKTDTVYLTLYNKDYAYVAVNMNNSLKDEIKVIGSVSSNDLTPEYLCGVVLEYSSCSIFDSDNNLYNNVIPNRALTYGTLLRGSEVNSKLNSLVPLADITKIKYTKTIPDGVSKVLVSTNDSKYPIYIYNIGTEVYFYTEADLINLNSISQRLFYNLSNVTEIDTNKIRVDDVLNGGEIFRGCAKLSHLDLSTWNLAKATLLGSLFDGCQILDNLDISNLNIHNVTTMQYMFKNCKRLSGTLDFSKWNLDNISSFTYTFQNCNNLENIIFPSGKTNVTSIAYAFINCNVLKSINFNNLEFTNLQSMYQTFQNCNALETIDLSKFNCKTLTNMDHTFALCNSLKTIDMSGIKTASIDTLAKAFYKCSSLTTVYVSNEWSNNSLTEEGKLDTFTDCNSLPGYIIKKDTSGINAKVNDGYFTLKG
ncbi:MAG: BspA family leucine-rich repeat surface protein [Bacilli bacterium]|nr:BspA family leucine-rich repeat surface protein [Bacilli bacterium]